MKPSPKENLQKLHSAIQYLKHNRTIKEMCGEYKVSPDVLDLIPIRFGPLEVSAKTQRGVLILNEKLLDNFSNNIHYLCHEIRHYFDQCYGKGPTQGADDGSYLDNKFEERAFKDQLQFLDDQFGPQEANKYVDHLLDHHEVENPKERSEKKQELMEKVNK